jgi:S-DNA-T family DNA segregation ATPase FtsK/SpoIIIE
MRGMTDPVLRRLWDLATPGVVFSYPREEGSFLGQAKPLTLPAGRAQFVHRREGVIQIQTAIAAPTEQAS